MANSLRWNRAKALGDAGELRAVNAWDSIGFTAYTRPGHNTHDIIAQATIEVKFDQQAARTGNAAIEVAHRGRASGLAVSVATLWQVDTGPEVFIIETERLRYLVNAGPFRHTRGGDDYLSDLILVPLADLRRWSLLILPGDSR